MFTFGRMTGDGLGRAVGVVSGTGGGEGGTEDQSDQGRGQVQQSLEDFLSILAFMLRAAGNQEGVSHPVPISEDDWLY